MWSMVTHESKFDDQKVRPARKVSWHTLWAHVENEEATWDQLSSNKCFTRRTIRRFDTVYRVKHNCNDPITKNVRQLASVSSHFHLICRGHFAVDCALSGGDWTVLQVFFYYKICN